MNLIARPRSHECAQHGAGSCKWFSCYIDGASSDVTIGMREHCATSSTTMLCKSPHSVRRFLPIQCRYLHHTSAPVVLRPACLRRAGLRLPHLARA
jgi:hypothetical protein